MICSIPMYTAPFVSFFITVPLASQVFYLKHPLLQWTATSSDQFVFDVFIFSSASHHLNPAWLQTGKPHETLPLQGDMAETWPSWSHLCLRSEPSNLTTIILFHVSLVIWSAKTGEPIIYKVYMYLPSVKQI